MKTIYKWDLNRIKKEYQSLNMLKMISKNEKDSELFNKSIIALNLLLRDNGVDMDPITNNNTDVYKNTILKIYQNNYIFDLNNFRNINTDFQFEDAKKYNFDIDDSLDIANDFFKNSNPEMYKYFLEFYNDKNNLLQVSNLDYSKAYLVPFYEKAYVEINEKTLKDMPISLIHEIGHYINIKINKYNCLSNQYGLGEVDTIFYELLMHDFLKQNISHYQNDLFFKKKMFSSWISCAMLITKQKDDTKSLIEYHKKYGILNNIEHLVSFPYALELYTLYKSNPTETLKILSEFIKSDNQEKCLKNNNIVPFTSMNSFIKQLERK